MVRKPQIETLLKQLDVEGEAEPRRIVAELISRRVDSESNVRTALINNGSCRIRRWCCEVIGGYKDSSLIPALEQATRDSHMSVRLHALIAISDFKDYRAIRAVIRLLQDESGGVRGNAVVACRSFIDSHPEVVTALLPLVNDEKWYVRREVALTLHSSRSDAEKKAIAALRRDQNASVRKAAEGRAPKTSGTP